MRDDERRAAASALAILATAAAFLVMPLAGCAPEPAPPALEEIRTRGELRVVTINSPTSYYLGTHGAEGLEFALARAFAKELGVTLVISPVPNQAAMQAELAAKRADIAAAQLTADPTWLFVGDAAEPYEQIEQLVVYRRGQTRPRGTLQIESARLAVRAGSPQERILQKLKSTVAPNLDWVVNRAQLRRSAGGCGFGPGQLRHRRFARVLVRAPSVSQCGGRLLAAHAATGAMGRAKGCAGPARQR